MAFLSRQPEEVSWSASIAWLQLFESVGRTKFSSPRTRPNVPLSPCSACWRRRFPGGLPRSCPGHAWISALRSAKGPALCSVWSPCRRRTICVHSCNGSGIWVRALRTGGVRRSPRHCRIDRFGGLPRHSPTLREPLVGWSSPHFALGARRIGSRLNFIKGLHVEKGPPRTLEPGPVRHTGAQRTPERGGCASAERRQRPESDSECCVGAGVRARRASRATRAPRRPQKPEKRLALRQLLRRHRRASG